MDELVELISFYPIVEKHGLSKWWLYKQLQKLTTGFKRGVLPSGKSSMSFLVPYEEMMHLILSASKQCSIETIVHRAWTVVYGRRMTHIASKSHGNWHQHYSTPRNKGRVAIATADDFFALSPRASFFIEYLEELKSVLAQNYYLQLKGFIEKIQRIARNYIAEKSKGKAVQNRITSHNYEEFYQLMLDGLLYGESPDVAFTRALAKAPKRSDKGSVKEYNTGTDNGIEHFASGESVAETTPFRMDFKKLRRSFAEYLLKERLLSVKQRKQSRLTDGDEKEACATAAQDMAILEFVLEGLTDVEIHERLELACTRQSLTMRRNWIMEKAREHFSPLRD